MDQFVAGEEVGVGAVGADPEQTRCKGAGAGGDQLDAAAGGLAGWLRSGSNPCGSHSYDVFLFVQVAVDQAFGRIEEDAAVVG